MQLSSFYWGWDWKKSYSMPTYAMVGYFDVRSRAGCRFVSSIKNVDLFRSFVECRLLDWVENIIYFCLIVFKAQHSSICLLPNFSRDVSW